MNTYYVGLADHDHTIYPYVNPIVFDHSNAFYASLIWVYIIFPFVGAMFGYFMFKSLMLKKGAWL